jgi:hypothetical protein
MASLQSIVPRNEPSGTPRRIEFHERHPASTEALDNGIVLSWQSSAVPPPVPYSVMSKARKNFNVLWSIVGLDAILVMYDLPGLQSSSKKVFCHQAVFVHIALAVCGWMLRS